MEKIKVKFYESLPYLTALGAILCTEKASSSLWGSFDLWIGGELGDISWTGVVSVFLFLLFTLLLYLQKDTFFRPRTRHLLVEKNIEKRKHLVLILSLLRKELVNDWGVPDNYLPLTDNLEEDLMRWDAMKKSHYIPNWSWEMTLRGICHHVGILETVTLICSEQSFPQVETFEKIFENYEKLKGIPVFLLVQKNKRFNLIKMRERTGYRAFDFQNLDELSRAFGSMLDEFNNRGIPDKDIIIDITGGQVPTSVSGVLMTLNRKIKAQYVQTNDPWTPVSYDVVYKSWDTGMLKT